jgi:transcriptional regulator with XRE-family HTH domain
MDKEAPNRIREWRKARGLTQAQLADMVSTSNVQISDLENGNVALTQQWMVKLAGALDVLPGDLLPVSQASGALDPEARALIDAYRAASPEQRHAFNAFRDSMATFGHAPSRKRA